MDYQDIESIKCGTVRLKPNETLKCHCMKLGPYWLLNPI